MNFNLRSVPKVIKTDDLMKVVTILLSLVAVSASLFTLYLNFFHEAKSFYAQQDGIVAPTPPSGDALKTKLNPNAHFVLINAGSKPLVIDQIYLSVFQPGKQRGERGDGPDFLTAPEEFNGSDCQGDLAVLPFRLLAPLLNPSTIGISEIIFSAAPDSEPNEVTLNDTNRSSGEPQFVFCLSLRIRDIHGNRYTANIPQWTARFKLDRGKLVDVENGFAWARKRDMDLFSDNKLMRPISD